MNPTPTGINARCRVFPGYPELFTFVHIKTTAMRNLLSSLIFLIILISGCNQVVKGKNGKEYKTAVAYNDAIVNHQSRIMKDILDFVEASKTSLDSADRLLDVYVGEINVIIEDIKGMPAFRGDTALRNAAVQSFGFYKRIMSGDYKELIRLRKEGAGETTEGMEQMNTIVEKISKEEEGYDKEFHRAQLAFAKKNNITLTDNDMQKKIDDLNN